MKPSTEHIIRNCQESSPTTSSFQFLYIRLVRKSEAPAPAVTVDSIQLSQYGGRGEWKQSAYHYLSPSPFLFPFPAIFWNRTLGNWRYCGSDGQLASGGVKHRAGTKNWSNFSKCVVWWLEGLAQRRGKQKHKMSRTGKHNTRKLRGEKSREYIQGWLGHQGSRKEFKVLKGMRVIAQLFGFSKPIFNLQKTFRWFSVVWVRFFMGLKTKGSTNLQETFRTANTCKKLKKHL